MDTSVLQDLDHGRKMIALEADVSVGSFDVRALVDRFLPDVPALFGSFVHRFAPSDEAIALTRDQQAFLKIIQDAKYLDLSPIRVRVPEGLGCSYLQYLNVLGPVVEYVSKVPERLSTYTTFLAMLVTNQDARFTTADNAVIYKEMEKTRIAMNKEMGALFLTGSHKVDVQYAQVVDRNSEWENVFKSLDKQNTQINHVNRKQLQKDAQTVSELMKKVIEIVEKKQMDKASPAAIMELADGAFQVASELEFFASVYYRMLALTHAVNESVKAIRAARQ